MLLHVLNSLLVFSAEKYCVIWIYHDLFIHSPVFGLFQVSEYCEKYCYEHLHTSLCLDICFHCSSLDT